MAYGKRRAIKYDKRRSIKVILPKSGRDVRGRSEGVWAYHLADRLDLPGGSGGGGVGILLNEPFDIPRAKAGDFLVYATAHPRILPHVVVLRREPDLAPDDPEGDFVSAPWTQADLRRWARTKGAAAKRFAVELLEESQPRLKRSLKSLPLPPTCDRCGGEWDLWMVKRGDWNLVGTRWRRKLLCWDCYREFTADKGGPRRPLSDKARMRAALRGEL